MGRMFLLLGFGGAYFWRSSVFREAYCSEFVLVNVENYTRGSCLLYRLRTRQKYTKIIYTNKNRKEPVNQRIYRAGSWSISDLLYGHSGPNETISDWSGMKQPVVYLAPNNLDIQQ